MKWTIIRLISKYLSGLIRKIRYISDKQQKAAEFKNAWLENRGKIKVESFCVPR